MTATTDFSSKPYNRCLRCHHRIEKRCDGPRTSAMELARWCEFMRDMKEINGLTNLQIAERSGLSLKTIERLMSQQNCGQDIMRDNARRIEDAIIGSSNQYPCYLAFEETMPQNTEKLNEAMRELEHALKDNEDHRIALANIHASYQAEIQAIRDEAHAQIEANRNEVRMQMQTIREEAQTKIDDLRQQVAYLQRENENLWAENNRKARLVDKFWEQQKIKIEDK